MKKQDSRLQPIFYTYVWWYIIDNEHIPFYVGKGKLKRYTAKAHFNNLEFKRIYDKYQCYCKFAIENVTDYEAIKKEIELIKLYGRRDLKLGTLINHTNGGDGIAGYKFTQEQLKKQREHLINNIHNNKSINEKRIRNSRIAIRKQETREKLSKIKKMQLKNNKNYYDKIVKHNREMWKNPERKQRMINNVKASFTEETRRKISEASKAQWTEEKRKEFGIKVKQRYSNPVERQKQSEIVKEAMSKLPKEKLSRRHVSKLSTETLLEMVDNRYLTQKQMAEKYNTSISIAKGIKAGTHWIYNYIKENNIQIKELPKNEKFRCSVSTEILLNIVKDKNMKRSELFNKYNNVSQKIICQIRNESHWIYKYIENNDISLGE